MSFVIFILLILFILAYVLISIFNRSFLDKRTFVFSIPIFIIGLILYSYGYANVYQHYDFISFTNCLTATIKSFAFEFKSEFVEPLFANDILFKVDTYMFVLLAGSTLISSIIGLFKISIKNFFGILIRGLKGADIVVGFNQNAINYCINNKNSVLFINSKSVKLTSEQKKNLYVDKIAFIYLPLSAKHLNNLIVLKGSINVICFDDGKTGLHVIYDLLTQIKTNSNMKYNNTEFVNSDGDEKIICSYCGHEAFLDEHGNYECPVCGRNGWIGECVYEGEALYDVEDVEELKG